MTVVWLLSGLLVAVVCATIAMRARRDADHPGVGSWSLLVSLLGVTAAGIAVLRATGIASDHGPSVELALVAAFAFTAVLWIGFVVAYTGRGPGLTVRRWIGLALLGCLTIASTTATWLHHAGRVDLGTVGQLSYVSTFFLQIGVFSLGLLGVLSIARSATTYDDVSDGTGAMLVACGLAITLLPFTIPLGQQVQMLRTTTVAFAQVGLVVGAFTAVQFGSGLFDRAPTAGHLARETVLETLSQPVVVVDRETRLLDLNDAARATFEVESGPLQTRRLRDVTGLDGAVTGRDGTISGEPISLETAAGQRTFVVRRNTIDDGDTVLGYAYRFRDVTDQHAREQRLQVLNRVIRHNLRNDLDAVRGFAEAIRDGDLTDDEAGRYFDRIDAIAGDVGDLASAIERSDRLLASESLQCTRCEPGAIADAVAMAATDHEIAVDQSADSCEIRSDPRVIRLLLDELVDNAIEHTDGETPTIEIDVVADDDGATIEVRDDGPGIPEDERDVLHDGAETEIAHGSGVGLWLVQWAVARLGGTLSLSTNDPRGSVVTVWLPDLQRAP